MLDLDEPSGSSGITTAELEERDAQAPGSEAEVIGCRTRRADYGSRTRQISE